MRANIKAWKLGYRLYRVNSKYLLTYERALAARKAVPENRDVLFEGRTKTGEWHCFYIRTTPVMMPPSAWD